MIKYYIGKTEITEEEWQKLAQKRVKVSDTVFSPNSAKSAMDIEIEKKGGIVDNMGNVHTTAHSYKNYLKANNLVIKDWTPGTLSKPKFQGCEYKDIPNF